MKRFSVVIVAMTLLMGRSALSQSLSPQMAASPAITKLFGSNTAFTAKLEIRLLGKPDYFMIADIVALDGKRRTEMDMAQMKSKEMPGAVAALKQMGLDRVATIVRPDKKMTYLMYPKIKAYVKMPLKNEETRDTTANLEMRSSPIAKETIDAHPCEINRVIITSEQGQELEAVVWNATDLRGFPVKIQYAPKGEDNVILQYKEVDLSKPNLNQFEVPDSFTAYDNIQQLQAAVVEKMDKAGKQEK